MGFFKLYTSTSKFQSKAITWGKIAPRIMKTMGMQDTEGSCSLQQHTEVLAAIIQVKNTISHIFPTSMQTGTCSPSNSGPACISAKFCNLDGLPELKDGSTVVLVSSFTVKIAACCWELADVTTDYRTQHRMPHWLNKDREKKQDTLLGWDCLATCMCKQPEI